MSQLFAPGGQSIGPSASASVLPMNTQDLFPLGWTGWISLQSKGLSGVFSNTTVQKHQFFSAQPSCGCLSALTMTLLHGSGSRAQAPGALERVQGCAPPMLGLPACCAAATESTSSAQRLPAALGRGGPSSGAPGATRRGRAGFAQRARGSREQGCSLPSDVQQGSGSRQPRVLDPLRACTCWLSSHTLQTQAREPCPPVGTCALAAGRLAGGEVGGDRRRHPCLSAPGLASPISVEPGLLLGGTVHSR